MPRTLVCAPYVSPLGRLWQGATDDGLYALSLDDDPDALGAPHRLAKTAPGSAAARHLEACATWLDGYFSGRPPGALPPLDWHGTAFQLRAWQELAKLPFGALTHYGELAATLGCRGPRAIGQAMGRNPWPILVPCHRVLAKNLGLGGYSGGLDRKIALLRHEGHRLDVSRTRLLAKGED